MKSSLFPVLMLFAAISFSYDAHCESPKAVKGVLDLRNTDISGNFNLMLNGEWEFYWNRMLRPHNFKSGATPIPDYYGIVPSYWTAYPADMVKTGKYGFATYRLQIILPPGEHGSLSLELPVFDSSYDLYINGEFSCSNGIPGRSENETKPGYSRKLVSFIPSSDTVSLLINVSNFHHRRGGFWLPLKMGTTSEINNRAEHAQQADWAAISVLLGFSLFFLFFYFLYPREKLLLFFSFGTIGFVARLFFTSNFLIQELTTPGWTWLIRFEYINLYQLLWGWTWFAATLYPSGSIRLFAWSVTGLSLFASVIIITTPVTVFSYLIFVLHPAILYLLLYLFYYSIKGMIRNNIPDFFYFTAFLLYSGGLIHDIRVSLGVSVSHFGYILSYVVIITIFFQAVLLLYKWVKAFHEKEKMQNDLEFLNRNLELMVNERTQELIKRNEEIEKQSFRINQQNRQLSETIQLKNKVFSVIAHDLRSPVVNILYMLNLLKEEEYKSRFESFTNSCINYSQMVINLLENMLVWGKGQEDKVNFSPEKHNLADVILTNLSIMKESADRKGIQVNFTQAGNPYAFFDRDLIDIVIRNLMSNAVKYTGKGGRISILMKNSPNGASGAMVRISDNGIGISAERQEKLFSVSEIDSTPGTDNEKGTGLGLKLCRELIDINNGSISVDSREGEGSCFTIILPAGG